MDTRKFVDRLSEYWSPVPDWVIALAHACDASSQTQAATKLGVSNGMISAALKNTYKGDMSTLETKVRGVFLAETVECPVVGEISKDRCLSNQDMKHIGTTPIRSKLRRQCPTCRHNRKG